jgi:predicted enzyme related to lactoylglutathione lyase
MQPSSSPSDGSLFGGVFARGQAAVEVGDQAFLQAMLDVEAALARAEALGATRVYGPNPVDDHSETGAFRDPAGNVFGVYHHGPH